MCPFYQVKDLVYTGFADYNTPFNFLPDTIFILETVEKNGRQNVWVAFL